MLHEFSDRCDASPPSRWRQLLFGLSVAVAGLAAVTSVWPIVRFML